MKARIAGVLAGMVMVVGGGVGHGQTPTQGLQREVWEGISGVSVSDLFNAPGFPDQPTSTDYVTDLFEAPTDILDQYGQRLHGYITPPRTGSYAFWIASDDGGALYLSTDDSPANAREIAYVSGWTGSREWAWEANQASEPIWLVAGTPYYIAAYMKEEGGGDNLAVRWVMPDGTDQGPIVGTNLLPYGVSFSAPVVSEQPTNTSVVEGDTARFAVRLAGPGVYHYAWSRNGTAIPDANGAELRYGPVLMSDQGARFRCVITNTIGSATSDEAVLAVLPDATPPGLVRVRNVGLSQIEVTFSEPVAAPSATQVQHYQLDTGASVTAAALGATPALVLLTTSTLTIGSSVTLTVNGVQDRAAQPNTIAGDSRFTFVVTEYAETDLGMPSLPGGCTSGAEGFEVRGSGDFGGTADNVQFAWQQKTGNFDLCARVSGLDPTDSFAKAGLMARDTLAAGSRFAAVLATPSTVGCFFMARTGVNASATRAGFFPVNYPETWLRLKRVGATLTGYASFDGQRWSSLGSAQISWSTTLYFGLTACSRNATELTTATFAEVKAVTGGSVVAYVPSGELLGPCSRQTPLVLSEIMYHPAERSDGRTGEFIELWNGDLIEQDLTGYRISGSVEYAFPDGTVLPAGGFAVVARVPADFEVIYGRPTLLGPFGQTNGLPADGGTVRLQDPQGVVLLEVEYDSRAPWPAAADGLGPSLVLARPSYGEADSRAWRASERVGGSPGQGETVRSDPEAGVVVNEFLAHTDDPEVDYVELYNHSTRAVDLSGCRLADGPGTNRFRIPDGTVLGARGFLMFDQNALGFRLDAEGETLVLYNSNLTRVVDAVRFGGQENGVASGRYPDGGTEIGHLADPTPGAENEPFRVSEVVINEIQYKPISGDNADEFVELHNRTDRAVDLSGWRFTAGIDFEFPSGTTLAGGGYLVVAKDRVRLQGNHPTLDPQRIVGDFDGVLANGGERLALARPDWIQETNEFGLVQTHRIDIEVDEVTYETGGRWPRWSDGLGSSLELIDPNSDHRRPSNWADSDETGKASWGTIELTGKPDNGDGGSADRLQIMMQGAGECLVDDLEVIPTGGANRLANPGFNTGISGWTIQGNHRTSSRENQGGVGNTGCLHLRTSGRGDTACNRVECAIQPALNLSAAAPTVTLRARVRWLKGWPEFLMRTRGSYLEAAGRMAVPGNLGTPGARNSRAVGNAGPAVFEVAHSPVLPPGEQSVLVTARLTDPDGIAAVWLRYRVDPSGGLVSVLMNDDGAAGDEVAGDGLFTGRIPGQPDETLVAFRVEATDARPDGPATAVFPADAPVHECLVRWGETQPFGNLGTYRLWQRQADFDWLRSRESLANDNLDATFVYNNGRAIYNMEMRGKGSPWHGGSVGSDYILSFPTDDRFLGAGDVALVTVGNLGSDDSVQREQAAFWIGQQMGLPALHRRHVFFYENGSLKQTVYEDTEEPGGSYVDRHWPDGEDGELYKIEDWFEFDTRGTSFTFNRDARLERYTTTGGAYKLARYRWAWRKRAVVDSANDYTHFFDLVTAVNTTGANRVPQVENLADMENWMRLFALQHIVGNWDAYGYSRGKNCYLYKPVSDRFVLIPWDIDFVLGSGGDGATADIFGVEDPTISTLWGEPAFLRVYLRAFLDAVHGPLQKARFNRVVDGRYAGLAGNQVSAATPTAMKNWVEQRRTYLANRVATFDTPAFAITSNGGNDFNTAQALVTLTGTAPLAIKTIAVNQMPVPVTWTSVTSWSVTLVLGARTNVLQFAGSDTHGNPVPEAADAITIRFTGVDLPSPVGQVVFSEILYHPAVSDASFVEILNTSTTASYDLSNWRVGGVDFEFPAGTVLRPGGRAVVVEDRDAFAAVYGYGVLPAGEFSGTLQNDGERLRLIRPGATPAEDLVVDQVRYEPKAPWPAAADGTGASLQLRDALQDNWRVANWAAAGPADAVKATPGKVNSVAAILPSFPLLFLNEIQSVNATGPSDQAGDRDPWIELHNSSDQSLDLSGLYLTSNYSNLTEWAFPAGTTLGAHAFLLVWADGETAETVPGELHTGFRLAPTNGTVALVRQQLGVPAVIDHVRYTDLPAGLSYGSYPDGQPQERRLFHLPSPREANRPGVPPIEVVVNEWLAGNSGVALDPADNDADDWFELHNAGATPADLSAYTLSDVVSTPDQYVIPNGTVIQPGGFLLVWADEEPGQTGLGQLHVNFRLAVSGDAIGLFTPEGAAVDVVHFGPQSNNISEGRFPDGIAEPFVFMVLPTPGRPNQYAAANYPPVLDPLTGQAVDEGQTVEFTASATDVDPEQHLTFTLVGAPIGAVIDADSGQFRWVTGEADGPADYAFGVRVTDDGVPPRSDTEAVTVTVREVNRPPTLEAIGDRVVDEGERLAFSVVAHDPDLPAQQRRFSFEAGAPSGATLDVASGAFAWVPAEDQGPGVYRITVRVTDDSQPSSSATGSFQITVREVDDAPVFSPVTLQTTEELSLFTLLLTAQDPDTPPRSLAYSVQSGPSGLELEAATGRVAWTPSEAQGPNSYNVVVRAVEVGGIQASTLTFSIVVQERNEAPSLESIADRFVVEGARIVITNVASDVDLPAQRLTFSLGPGAPLGATVDSATGVFRWEVGGDAGSSTNVITVRVADDAPDALTTRRSFTVTVRAEPRIVINEIQHHPAIAGAEFIELHNASTNTAWSLDGWQLTGAEFAFPGGIVLAPAGFLVVARDLSVFREAYGASATAAGDFVNGLGPSGGTIRLLRPDPEGGTLVVDEVRFGTGAPWPALANSGGPSLQLIDPLQDNTRVGNWAAVGASTTNRVVPVLPMNASWWYWQAAANPAEGWTNRVYDDSAWPTGRALLYVEGSAMPAAQNTPLVLGQLSYLFRTRFQFDGNTEGASLRFQTVIDDGAVFYLNGEEVYRLGVEDGIEVERSTLANRTVDNAVYEGPFTEPVTRLRQGENVFAVEVHQNNSGSSDIVMGTSVEVIESPPRISTPGSVNSVRATLDPFPAVFLNEVLVQNTMGPVDSAGDLDPWVELVNASDEVAWLEGCFLSSRYSDLAQSAFPVGAALDAGQYALVWCDGEPGETQLEEWHAAFGLESPAGVVVLARLQNGQPAIVDFLEYSGLGSDQSFGYPVPREVSSVPGLLPQATPGAANEEPPAPAPQVLALSLAPDGAATLRWTSVAGRVYRIESKTTLNELVWQSRADTPAGGAEASYTDPTPFSGEGRFYRVVLLPR